MTAILKATNLETGSIKEFTCNDTQCLENSPLDLEINIENLAEFKKYVSSHAGPYAVEISDNVTRIGDKAFKGYRNIVSIKAGNHVTHIGQEAFSDSRRLSTVMVPSIVKSIGDWAFSGCRSLNSIYFCNGLTDIGKSVFFMARNLSEVNIPATVRTISEDCFTKCSSLNQISVSDPNLPIFNIKDAKSQEIVKVSLFEFVFNRHQPLLILQTLKKYGSKIDYSQIKDNFERVSFLMRKSFKSAILEQIKKEKPLDQKFILKNLIKEPPFLQILLTSENKDLVYYVLFTLSKNLHSIDVSDSKLNEVQEISSIPAQTLKDKSLFYKLINHLCENEKAYKEFQKAAKNNSSYLQEHLKENLGYKDLNVFNHQSSNRIILSFLTYEERSEIRQLSKSCSK